MGNRPPKNPMMRNFLFGGFLIVISTAVVTSSWLYREVNKVTEVLKQSQDLKVEKHLAPVTYGSPQTVLLIGSDQRAKTARDYKIDSSARADTMMLVRLDPDLKSINLLSLPRDLQVEIPGRGSNRLNASYTLGGAKLALLTVKELMGLEIHNVVDINFRSFQEIVNAVGCVFIDIDRRYFVAEASDHAAINLQPGYQRICGKAGLDYVRYRHADSDFSRAARQQNFLRQLRQQVGIKRAFEERDQLLKIFGRYTSSSLKDQGDLIDLAGLALASMRHPVRQIEFLGEAGPSLVRTSPRAVRRMRNRLLGKDRYSVTSSSPNTRRSRKDRTPIYLNRVTPQAKAAASALNLQNIVLPLFYPTKLPSGDSFIQSRAYNLKIPGRAIYPSYRIVISHPATGEYYGVQGTTWKDPPILKESHEPRALRGKSFRFYYDAGKLRLIAWQTPQGSFWITNTLRYALKEAELTRIALSVRDMGSQ